MSSFNVGDIVYGNYNPQRPGKVIETYQIEKYGHPYNMAKVKWVNGTESEVWELQIRSLTELIANHDKTLKNHLKRLAKAQAL